MAAMVEEAGGLGGRLAGGAWQERERAVEPATERLLLSWQRWLLACCSHQTSLLLPVRVLLVPTLCHLPARLAACLPACLQDLRHMPALHDLIKAWMRVVLSGDKSQWDAALTMPHYSTYSMPALSMHTGAHVSTQLQRIGLPTCLPTGLRC